MRLHETVLCAVLAFAAVGCESEDVFSSSLTTQTEIAVRPADFLGHGVACSARTGGMQSYVLTLHAFDDVLDASAFQIGSTTAASCAVAIGFRNVIIAGKLYVAEIDGYEQPAHDLLPRFGASSGAREMLDKTTGELVSPRWTTRCGHSAVDAVEAQAEAKEYVSPCDPLLDHAQAETRIVIDPVRVLGEDPCAVAPQFDMMSLQGGLGTQLQIACDAQPLALPAVANRSYRLHATMATDQNVNLGSSCTASAVAGQHVPLTCGSLTTTGAVRFDLTDPVTGKSAACPPGSFFAVSQEGELLTEVPGSCGSQVHVGGLNPGIYIFSLLLLDNQGQATGGEVSCAAQVSAGLTVDATCLL